MLAQVNQALAIPSGFSSSIPTKSNQLSYLMDITFQLCFQGSKSTPLSKSVLWIFFLGGGRGLLWFGFELEVTQTLGSNFGQNEIPPWGEAFTGWGPTCSSPFATRLSTQTHTCFSQWLNKWPNPRTYSASIAQQMFDFLDKVEQL